MLNGVRRPDARSSHCSGVVSSPKFTRRSGGAVFSLLSLVSNTSANSLDSDKSDRIKYLEKLPAFIHEILEYNLVKNRQTKKTMPDVAPKAHRH